MLTVLELCERSHVAFLSECLQSVWLTISSSLTPPSKVSHFTMHSENETASSNYPWLTFHYICITVECEFLQPASSTVQLAMQ